MINSTLMVPELIDEWCALCDSDFEAESASSMGVLLVLMETQLVTVP